MERTWKAVAGILAAWNVLLGWYGYVQARETQRMLCHHSWPQKSVIECRSYFTGNSGVYMIVLGVGTLLALTVMAVLLLRRPPHRPSTSGSTGPGD